MTIGYMFDYSKLRTRIKEIFSTQEKFASAMGISRSVLNLKLNNASAWTQSEIVLASKLLKIPDGEYDQYFFYLKSLENETITGN